MVKFWQADKVFQQWRDLYDFLDSAVQRLQGNPSRLGNIPVRLLATRMSHLHTEAYPRLRDARETLLEQLQVVGMTAALIAKTSGEIHEWMARVNGDLGFRVLGLLGV